MSRIDWTKALNGDELPLHEQAARLRSEGWGYPSIARMIGERIGKKVGASSVMKIMTRYHPELRGTQQSPAAYGRQRPPAPAREPEMAAAPADPPEVDTQGAHGQASAPVLLHVAREGFEIWIRADSDAEMSIKAAEAINIINLVAASE